VTGDFWRQLAQLVAESEIVIDRPQGSAHPRYPDFVYPDWITAAACTVDLVSGMWR